jgi:iron complex outermembrane receptor protein
MMKKTNIINAAITIACFHSYDLYANESPQQQSDKIEVIQVTAQKHAQNPEDIAVSVSVITGKTIVDQNLKDTTALSALVPNFRISKNFAEGTPPAVNIRGVGSVDYNTSTTSPVGIYLDNVTGGSANSQVINLFDIESIEVLRGPQGTLFGRNTNAGAMLIRSQRPQEEFGGYFIFGLAEQQHEKFEGAVNLPINDNVAGRFAFSHQDYGYSTNNLYPSAPEAGMQQQQWRASILGQWQDIEIFAKVHQEDWDGIVLPNGHIGVVKEVDPTGGSNHVLCSPEQAGAAYCTDVFGFSDGSDNFHDVMVNSDAYDNSPHKTQSWGTDIQLKYQVNEQYHIESISSYNTLERLVSFNDTSPAKFIEGNMGVDTKVYTQEVRVHADFENQYVIAGLYFLDESIVQNNFLDLFREFRVVPQAFGGAAVYFWDNTIDTTAFAVFAHSEYQLSDNATFTMGLRYSDESTDYNAVAAINIPQEVNDQTGVTMPAWNFSGDVKDDNLSGKLAFNYILSEQISGFASYSRGFKSGGYNGAFVFSPLEAQENDFGGETLDAYEIGARLNWDDSNARLNLAVFYNDYQDQQILMTKQKEPGSPPFQTLDNVGQSVTYGAEADLTWQLNPALKVQFAVGYLPEAKLEQFVNAIGNEVNDNRLPYTPKWTVGGLAEYVIFLAEAELVFQLNFDHQSDFYFDQNQNAYTRQPSYTLFNGRIAYEHQDWTVALWGKNITDREYYQWKLDFIGFMGNLQDHKGEAQQFGIDVSYTF